NITGGHRSSSIVKDKRFIIIHYENSDINSKKDKSFIVTHYEDIQQSGAFRSKRPISLQSMAADRSHSQPVDNHGSHIGGRYTPPNDTRKTNNVGNNSNYSNLLDQTFRLVKNTNQNLQLLNN